MKTSKNRKTYTRRQLAEMSAKMPSLPGELDGITLGPLLMELLEAEQLNIATQSFAILLGIAKAVTERAISSACKSTHVDGNDNPVYTAREIAVLVGSTPDAVIAGIASIRSELGNDVADKLIVAPKNVSSLH